MALARASGASPLSLWLFASRGQALLDGDALTWLTGAPGAGVRRRGCMVFAWLLMPVVSRRRWYPAVFNGRQSNSRGVARGAQRVLFHQ